MCLSNLAHAGYKDDLIQKASEQKLWNTPEWLALLHYDKTSDNNYKSIVSSPQFFFAKDGKNNPQSEMISTIEAFFNNDVEEKEKTIKIRRNISQTIIESHPICTFKARYRLLNKSLDFDESQMPSPECERYKKFAKKHQSTSVTLVFADEHLNQPSSLFGHTFLKLDTYRGEDVDILSHIVNFGAVTPENPNGFAYAYNGLSGGYPGVFDIMPYYDKIKTYGAIDNRDIWEYKLNFTQEEIDLLIDHVWEMGYQHIDYYFFDDNCAYMVLELIESVKPGMDLTSPYQVHAIPVDTINAVLDEPNLFEKLEYRPSLKSKIDSKYYQLTDEERAIFKKLNNKEIDLALLSELPPKSQARIIETIYDLQQYKLAKRKMSMEDMSKNTIKLLKARHKLDGVKSDFIPPKRPEFNPEDTHESSSLETSIGYDDDVFTDVLIRPAYHSLYNNAQARSFGSQIEVLDLRFRYYPDEEELQLRQFTFANITSLVPYDELSKSLSWKLGLKAEKTLKTDKFDDSLMGTAHAAGGYTVDLGDEFLVYAMAEGQLNSGSNDLPSDFMTGLGGSLGIAANFDDYKLIAETKSISFIDDDEYNFIENNATLSHHLDLNNSLFLRYKNKIFKDYEDDNEITLGYSHHFRLF